MYYFVRIFLDKITQSDDFMCLWIIICVSANYYIKMYQKQQLIVISMTL